MPSSTIVTKRTVTVHDKMQRSYTYLLTEPVGKNFHPDFTPQLTPADMLELGVFGGRYLTDCKAEFPAAWFAKAKLYHGPSPRGDAQLNYFKVDASQPLSVWKKKGWINPQDPRGWFQWYCRYFMGRRSEDDLRQIGRWKAMVRHIAQIKKGCRPGDTSCRRKQRQALLHWAYDSLNI
ncbi:hypothetical protein HRG84_11975 [Flavisolibacter sp. BT320]|nr:hypothetical protein [Flavisolibacter longurius]